MGSYLPSRIGGTNVLCIKSELHLNQDGIKTGEGTATLPVRDFFTQIITEVRPSVFLTIGTAGSVFDDFQLGDVVITRAAKFGTPPTGSTGRAPLWRADHLGGRLLHRLRALDQHDRSYRDLGGDLLASLTPSDCAPSAVYRTTMPVCRGPAPP